MFCLWISYRIYERKWMSNRPIWKGTCILEDGGNLSFARVFFNSLISKFISLELKLMRRIRLRLYFVICEVGTRCSVILVILYISLFESMLSVLAHHRTSLKIWWEWFLWRNDHNKQINKRASSRSNQSRSRRRARAGDVEIMINESIFGNLTKQISLGLRVKVLHWIY